MGLSKKFRDFHNNFFRESIFPFQGRAFCKRQKRMRNTANRLPPHLRFSYSYRRSGEQFQTKKQRADHLYMDLNAILHEVVLKIQKNILSPKEFANMKASRAALHQARMQEIERCKALGIPANIGNEKMPSKYDKLDLTAPSKEQIEQVCTELISRIEVYVEYFNPQSTIFLALDGPSPLAKLVEQCSRRKASLRSELAQYGSAIAQGKPFLSSLAISPASQFMMAVEARLKQWADGYMQRRIPNTTQSDESDIQDSSEEPLQIYVSSSLCEGEGETKIMHHIINHNTPGSEDELYVLVSPDSDVAAMSLLCVGKPNMIVLSDTSLFSKNHAIRVLRNYINPTSPFNYDRLFIDYVLWANSFGNDYIKSKSKLIPSPGSIPKFLKSSTSSNQFVVKLHSSDNPQPTSICDGQDERAVEQRHSIVLDMTTVNSLVRSNANSTENIDQLMEACLWCIDMYLHGICGDYMFQMESLNDSSSLTLSNMDAQSFPISSGPYVEKARKNVKHAICPMLALMMLTPKSARCLLPATLVKQIEKFPRVDELLNLLHNANKRKTVEASLVLELIELFTTQLSAFGSDECNWLKSTSVLSHATMLSSDGQWRPYVQDYSTGILSQTVINVLSESEPGSPELDWMFNPHITIFGASRIRPGISKRSTKKRKREETCNPPRDNLKMRKVGKQRGRRFQPHSRNDQTG